MSEEYTRPRILPYIAWRIILVFSSSPGQEASLGFIGLDPAPILHLWVVKAVIAFDLEIRPGSEVAGIPQLAHLKPSRAEGRSRKGHGVLDCVCGPPPARPLSHRLVFVENRQRQPQ